MSIFHVDYLKNTFNDFARPNLYKVKFQVSGLSGPIEEVEMTVKTVNIPAFDIGKIELRRMGQRYYIPTSQNFGDVQMNLICDDKYLQRRLLHTWVKNAVYNTDSNIYFPLKRITESHVVITQLDNKFKEIFAVKLHAIWPTSIGEIQFAQDSDGQVTEFPITLSYSNYEIINKG